MHRTILFPRSKAIKDGADSNMAKVSDVFSVPFLRRSVKLRCNTGNIKQKSKTNKCTNNTNFAIPKLLRMNLYGKKYRTAKGE